MRLIVDIANVEESRVESIIEETAFYLDKKYNTPVTVNCIDATNSKQFYENYNNIDALREAHLNNG